MMKLFNNELITVLLIGIWLTTSACAASSPRSTREDIGDHEVLSSPTGNVVVAGNFSAPVVAPSQGSRAVTSVNQLATDLYSELTKRASGNLLFSPYSITSALAMLYAGASGDTKTQMATTLHFGTASDEEIHQAFADLNHSLLSKGSSGTYQLKVANALWGPAQSSGVANKKPFRDTLQKFYEATMKLVNFKSEAESARQTINAWVEQQTAQKIKELLPRGSVNKNTQLVLTNALYFKASWAIPFEENKTKPLPFTTPSGTLSVPTMEITGTFRYFEHQQWQAIELPYAKPSDLTMVILLPKAGQSLSSLSPQEWLMILDSTFEEKVVNIQLPKFKVESTFELKDYLQALQMVDAFTEGRANFAAISQDPLVLSAVMHKTFVDVNETGTEAAAATAVVASRALNGAIEPAITFHVDHPFRLVIKTPGGAILFLGQVEKPDS